MESIQANFTESQFKGVIVTWKKYVAQNSRYHNNTLQSLNYIEKSDWLNHGNHENFIKPRPIFYSILAIL